MLPKAPSRYNPFKNKELAKFRRNLVIKNLFDNSYIDKDSYNKLVSKDIILNKRKKIYLEDANYYVEDVRKSLVNKFGFDKVYKQGFTIKTPLDLNLQAVASESLRQGLISYDKRKGWRGPLKNTSYIQNWDKDLKKHELEKNINWELAIVKKINKFSVDIQTI